jgi:hypothetical protein
MTQDLLHVTVRAAFEEWGLQGSICNVSRLQLFLLCSSILQKTGNSAIMGGCCCHRCTGEKFADQSALYTTRMNNTLGPRAVKALYRAYSDDTFKTPLPHDPKLGILGPLVQAQVGVRMLCGACPAWLRHQLADVTVLVV